MSGPSHFENHFIGTRGIFGMLVFIFYTVVPIVHLWEWSIDTKNQVALFS